MTADQYRSFIKQVLPSLGYQWRRFDRKNIRRKVRRRMEYLGLRDPGEFAVLLTEDPDECRLFESLLPITITRFFRNAQLWSDLGSLLSEFVRRLGAEVPYLRLWSAGCAGGEEVFTAAMLLNDAVEAGAIALSWTILGTDIDESLLERTINASYSWGAVREVPERMRRRWFREDAGHWVLKEKIRDLVEFRVHDVIRDKPPGFFHTVLLRNSVLTYNTEDVQRTVLKKVRGCLLEPGFLFIGRTERIPEGTGFEKVSECIYRKV